MVINMKFIGLLIGSAIYLPVLALCAFIPFAFQHGMLFGVKIPENEWDNPVFKQIRRHYVLTVFALGAIFYICLLSLWSLVSENMLVIIYVSGVLLVVAFPFFLFFFENKRIQALVADNVKLQPTQKPPYTLIEYNREEYKKRLPVKPVHYLLHLVVIGITLGIGYYFYDRMPDMVPMNYDFSGHVSSYANKSMRLIWFAPFVQLFLMLVFLLVNFVMTRAVVYYDDKNVTQPYEKDFLLKSRWSLFLFWMGILLQLIFVIMQLNMVGIITNMYVIVFLPLLFVLAIFIGLFKLSFATKKLNIPDSFYKNASDEVINRSDEKYWKLSLFYYNKEDKALFIKKRYGIGWTSNFARPASYFMLLGLIAVVVLFAVFTTKLVY